MSLFERGEICRRFAVAKAGGGVAQDVARRQVDALRKGLQWKRGAAGNPRLGDDVLHERIVDVAGGGNVVYAVLEYENVNAVFTSVGDRGKSAAAVAQEVVEGVLAYSAHGAPVDEFLADQLLLPMALGAGGSFRATVGSLHMTTNAALINRFLGPDTVTWRALSGGDIAVEVKGCFALASAAAERGVGQRAAASGSKSSADAACGPGPLTAGASSSSEAATGAAGDSAPARADGLGLSAASGVGALPVAPAPGSTSIRINAGTEVTDATAHRASTAEDVPGSASGAGGPCPEPGVCANGAYE